MSKNLKEYIGVNSFLERPDGTKVSHEEFYTKIVNDIGLDVCKMYIPFELSEIRKALAKGDEHLNTLPIKEWDNVHDVFKYQFMSHLKVNVLSISNTVCTLKRAARMWAEEATEDTVNNCTCEICQKKLNAYYSLCDECDKQVGEWDEETDSYSRLDGNGYYQFCPRTGVYQWRKVLVR